MTRVKRSNPSKCAPSAPAADLAQVTGGASMVEYALLTQVRGGVTAIEYGLVAAVVPIHWELAD